MFVVGDLSPETVKALTTTGAFCSGFSHFSFVVMGDKLQILNSNFNLLTVLGDKSPTTNSKLQTPNYKRVHLLCSPPFNLFLFDAINHVNSKDIP
jgi:hypothetical protein